METGLQRLSFGKHCLILAFQVVSDAPPFVHHHFHALDIAHRRWLQDFVSQAMFGTPGGESSWRISWRVQIVNPEGRGMERETERRRGAHCNPLFCNLTDKRSQYLFVRGNRRTLTTLKAQARNYSQLTWVSLAH